MIKNTNSSQRGSISKAFLISLAGIIVIALSAHAVSARSSIFSSVLGEDDEVSTEQSGGGDSSTDSDEESTNEVSTEVDEEISTPSTETSVETSTPKALNETSVVDELSQASAPDEQSEVSTENEMSVSDFDVVEERSQGMAVVSNKERLLFIIPVEIQKTVELDDSGNIVGIKQTLLSKILELLSF